MERTYYLYILGAREVEELRKKRSPAETEKKSIGTK
jgi:hypothetical protein